MLHAHRVRLGRRGRNQVIQVSKSLLLRLENIFEPFAAILQEIQYMFESLQSRLAEIRHFCHKQLRQYSQKSRTFFHSLGIGAIRWRSLKFCPVHRESMGSNFSENLQARPRRPSHSWVILGRCPAAVMRESGECPAWASSVPAESQNIWERSACSSRCLITFSAAGERQMFQQTKRIERNFVSEFNIDSRA